MLKNFLKVSLVIGAAVIALSMQAKAQTVTFNAIGSSAFWLEAGLGTQQFLAPCLWTENTNTAFATDTSVSPSAVDKGSAWVAWTKGSDGTCATASGSVYAYLNTDSVVGNRCLFNSTTCTITYPTGPVATANAIYPSTGTCGSTTSPGECTLPAVVSTALNTFAKANAAATDIRPEDAEFATARALKMQCGDPVGGSQYLGLGYTNGATINSAIPSSTKSFHVVNFSLPSSYTVTTVGATPVLVVVHGDGTSTGFATSGNLTNANLAKLLDGTTQTTPLGGAANILILEPLSGAWNVMEYNIPNTTGSTLGITPASANYTSQEVGANQLSALQNCMVDPNTGRKVAKYPQIFVNSSTCATRLRAIGTAEELQQVGAYANACGGTNNLGYGFWSVANFASLGAVTHTGYYEVDNIDPLNAATGCSYTGTIPTNGTTALKCVDLHTVYTGTYPIWSLLRLVTTTSGGTTAATNVAGAAQSFVSFGTTTSRPDFVTPDQMQVVRSHFIPPFGAGEPTTASNGVTGCTTEQGGDVGGVVFSNTGSSKCTTGQRR